MKRKEAAFLAAQALVVAAVLALVSLPLQSGVLQGQSSSVVARPSSCEGLDEVWGPNYGYSGVDSNSASTSIPVLRMEPNTTGYVCIVYQSKIGVPLTADLVNLLRIGTYGCNSQNQCGLLLYPNSFKVNGSLANSTEPFTDNSTVSYAAVVYSISALGNSTGFYDVSAPLRFCGTMPLAVGNLDSKLNSTDFGGYLNPALLLCPHMDYVPIEVSVAGIQVDQVDFPNP